MELAAIFERADVRGFVHACEVDGDREVGIDPDELVVAASVFKVPVLLELTRRISDGEFDAQERVVVPADRRTIGPTGISTMRDDVDLSLRDLALSMMCVSDNTATDVIMEMVGLDRINATLRSLGFEHTVLVDDCQGLIASMLEDLGLADTGEVLAVEPENLARVRVLQPAETNRTTPREMTRLLSMIWRDEAGPADACAEVRRIMALQVWPHRLTAGFPDGVAVAGKTGTLPSIRNEAGVVTYPDGRRYAVAVFLTEHTYEFRHPPGDAAIAAAARAAVDTLRTSS